MTAIDRLIVLMKENLDGFTRHDIDSDSYNRGFAYCLEDYLDKAKTLAAEEAEAKPKADKGLVAKIEELAETLDGEKQVTAPIAKRIRQILSRYTDDKSKEESIAELARRKGFKCVKIWPYANGGCAVDLWASDSVLVGHEGESFQEAEAKAREWLMGQGDK